MSLSLIHILFAENGLGVAAFEEGRMLGFLGCYEPWENAFTGTARGTFSPIEAHGAVPEQREKIYRLLYQAAAEMCIRDRGYAVPPDFFRRSHATVSRTV